MGFKFFPEGETFDSLVPKEPGVYILDVVKGVYVTDESGGLKVVYIPAQLFLHVTE